MIDSRAVIDPSAIIGEDVSIGPYSIIGADVELGDGTWLGPHVVIQGPTRIGKNNRIFQFSSIGDEPQDKKYAGEDTRLEIGDRNTIREYVTISRGTVQDRGVTRIGDDNWIMTSVHIAHDCIIGNQTTFANNATLAGHVTIADHVILGGFTLVHQFCAIGEYAFTAMGTAIGKDVPPYMMVSGNPAKTHGLNSEGLKRSGVSTKILSELKQAYKILYRSKQNLDKAIEALEQISSCDESRSLVCFLKKSSRSIVR